jgi:hypothetical protein
MNADKVRKWKKGVHSYMIISTGLNVDASQIHVQLVVTKAISLVTHAAK